MKCCFKIRQLGFFWGVTCSLGNNILYVSSEHCHQNYRQCCVGWLKKGKAARTWFYKETSHVLCGQINQYEDNTPSVFRCYFQIRNYFTSDFAYSNSSKNAKPISSQVDPRQECLVVIKFSTNLSKKPTHDFICYATMPKFLYWDIIPNLFSLKKGSSLVMISCLHKDLS